MYSSKNVRISTFRFLSSFYLCHKYQLSSSFCFWTVQEHQFYVTGNPNRYLTRHCFGTTFPLRNGSLASALEPCDYNGPNGRLYVVEFGQAKNSSLVVTSQFNVTV